jgi:acetyltransferase-like isoleucine patch superfamily enzyme
MSDFLLKIRRGETPFYQGLRKTAQAVLEANLPVPASLQPFFRFLYSFHFAVLDLLQGVITFFYREPIFRARCASAGRHLKLARLPEIYGHTSIHLGEGVSFTGVSAITSGRFFDNPTLIIKDRAIIGHQVLLSVNQEIIIEEDVMIANHCAITDNDGHPRAMDLRIQHVPLTARDIRPVRICRGAWLGRGVQVMKGVTIGEGAIISANSVVMSDIPPYALAMGNPAEVIMRGAGKPSKRNPVPSAAPNLQAVQRNSVAPHE